jgi:hypothetical protein
VTTMDRVAMSVGVVAATWASPKFVPLLAVKDSRSFCTTNEVPNCIGPT